MRINLNESTLEKKELDGIIDLFTTNRLTMGSRCIEFENTFSQSFGVKHAVMVNSGSSANLLAFFAIANPIINDLKILPTVSSGSEIIVPALTWSTSVWPIIQIGCIPVFVDSNPNTLQMDLNAVEAAITPKTKAICAPHILGNAINLQKLKQLADKYGLWLIEDTCEALGVKNNGKFAGTEGHFGTYSFYFSHHITTIEGGMIVTNDDALADVVRSMRAHGWIRHMHHAENYIKENPTIDPRFLFISTGFNVRPTEINAVLGISQLKKLNAFNEKRNAIKTTWDTAFKKLQDNGTLTSIEITDGTEAALFGYPVICKDEKLKNELQCYLEKNDIETRPIICGNLTRQPALKYHQYRIQGELKGTDHIMNCGLYWGIHPMMTSDQIHYVSNTVLGFFK
ncbi:MAG: hypothetical protein A3C44_03265 [Gammaproteobacteria bacterium RIFCSPHIGHO2_02_FULL_39_13]|nr:MAG: hypothetical protein A3C44_03265 [Gammaproteobacteria bacterium RIFCSPHIGHO2_02_FULL_39_13]OGT48550.1 MAG: hypothetical protein A3E53_04155 [Gammaproteobacteria bacterium RIFCSPHIGHO2_12_FULL_39_24]